VLLAWEAFLKSFVLGWVLLPVWGVMRLRRRKAENQEERLRSRHLQMKLTAEAFVEALQR
jgi:hypothetical protein